MLAEIYGKDKATGQASESFIQAATNIEMDLTRESTTLDSDEDFDVEAETENESMQSGSSSRKRKDSSSSKSAKKYKTSMKRMENVGDLTSSLQSVTVEFGKVFHDMNSNLSAMAQVWSSEEERKKKLDDETNKILEEVLKLDFLSPSEALEVKLMIFSNDLIMEFEHGCLKLKCLWNMIGGVHSNGRGTQASLVLSSICNI